MTTSTTIDRAIEAEIQTKGLTAPRVTPADVEAAIASEFYFTGEDGVNGSLDAERARGSFIDAIVPPALGGLMVCVLVLKNGHLVTGEALLQDLSKPDPERARASARRRAFDKAYDMVVYAERERLAALSSIELDIADSVDMRETFPGEDRVAVPRGLIGAACSAIDKKREGSKVLAELRRYTTGDLSAALSVDPTSFKLSLAAISRTSHLLRPGAEERLHRHR